MSDNYFYETILLTRNVAKYIKMSKTVFFLLESATYAPDVVWIHARFLPQLNVMCFSTESFVFPRFSTSSSMI